MKRWIVLTALLLGWVARAEADPESGLESRADTLLIGVPALALGLTFLLPDDISAKPAGFDLLRMTGAPRHDLGLALLRATTVTYGLKYAVDEERPNGEDGAFPSGHTAITFAGAEFIRKEYGLAWGAPAYLAASYVGWSRVETLDHWWRDVLAGAAIGVLSNHDLGTLSGRWGGLSLKPAMLMSTGAQAEPSAGLEPRPAAAPGLKLELRF